MTTSSALKINNENYPNLRSVDDDLQQDYPNLSYYQSRKHWTVEDWKRHLRTQKSDWKVLPKSILNCDAYWELSNTAKAILSRAFAELRFDKKVKKTMRHGNKSLFNNLQAPHDFCLPYGMLKAAGVGSKPTVSKGLSELKESGWLVQVNARSAWGLSVYRLGPDVLNESIIRRRPKVVVK